MTRVLDLVRYRLEREAESEPDPLLAEAARSVIQLYDWGVVDARLEGGEVLLSLSRMAEEALPAGGLCELLDRLEEEHAAAAAPLNASPST